MDTSITVDEEKEQLVQIVEIDTTYTLDACEKLFIGVAAIGLVLYVVLYLAVLYTITN